MVEIGSIPIGGVGDAPDASGFDSNASGLALVCCWFVSGNALDASGRVADVSGRWGSNVSLDSDVTGRFAPDAPGPMTNDTTRDIHCMVVVASRAATSALVVGGVARPKSNSS